MKKILYTLSFLGVSTLMVAQPALSPLEKYKDRGSSFISQELRVHQQMDDSRIGEFTSQQDVASPNQALYSRSVIWSNNFDDPSEWIFGNDGTPSADWIITDQAPQGAVSSTYGVIQSTSGGNYALFDSNFLGEGQANAEQDAWIQFAAPIDLSDHSCVNLQFESRYGSRFTIPLVEYSLDGNEWIGFNPHSFFEINDFTPNPGIVNQNLSTQIGLQSEVYLRFRFVGEPGYFWMIDDVKLVVPVDNDIAIEEAHWNNWTDIWYSNQSVLTWDDAAFVSGYEYSHMPASQPHPMNLRMYVSNKGCLAQTGVKVVATLSGPEGFNVLESAPITLPIGRDTLLFLNDGFPQSFVDGVEGSYTVSYAVAADDDDENLANNVVEDDSFELTNGELANHGDLSQVLIARNYQGRTIGARFTFPEATTVTHMRFALFNNPANPNHTNQIGQFLYPNMRASSVIQTAGANNPGSALYGLSQISYVIAENDLNTPTTLNSGVKFILIPLPNVGASGMPPQVVPNQVYQGEIAFPSDNNSPPVPVASILFQPDGEPFAGVIAPPSSGTGVGQGWQWHGDRPFIRFAIEGSSVNVKGVDELRFDMAQNYPNPTTGETTIEWKLMYPGKNIRFDIYDMNGRNVFSKDLGDRPAGQQEPLILDLNKFSAGNYQYSITVGDERMVRKMVIVK